VVETHVNQEINGRGAMQVFCTRSWMPNLHFAKLETGLPSTKLIFRDEVLFLLICRAAFFRISHSEETSYVAAAQDSEAGGVRGCFFKERWRGWN
jgi:hypothetical protein